MNGLTKYWFLDGFNLFKKLSMVTMMRMCENLEIKNIDKGTRISLINRNKKSIFFLKKGTVKIVNTTNDTVKYVVKRGNIFGELSLYDEQTSKEEVAYALEDCIICYMESELMKDLMEKNKSLKNGILKIYGYRIKKLERRLQDLLYKDSPERIKDFTLDYLEEFGEKDDFGNLVANNLLSHKDIANLTNTSRQTVSNVMSLMRKEGFIFYDSQTISMQALQSTNVLHDHAAINTS